MPFISLYLQKPTLRSCLYMKSLKSIADNVHTANHRFVVSLIILAVILLFMIVLSSCKDEPEPFEEPDVPFEEPDVEHQNWPSWFDLDDELRWPTTWRFGDSDELFGPGEYEFTINPEGGEYVFLFPSNHKTTDYVVSDNMFVGHKDKILTNKILYGYSISGANNESGIVGVRITVSSNPTAEHRSISVCTSPGLQSKNGYIKHTIQQLPGTEYIKSQTGIAQWKSYKNTFKVKKPRHNAISNHMETLCKPSGEQFKLKCLNYNGLFIRSLAIDGNDIEIIDGKQVNSPYISISASDDILDIDIQKNDSDSERTFLVDVDSEGLLSRFSITQSPESQPSTMFAEVRTPAWKLRNDGDEWSGEKAFKVDASGQNFYISSTNYTEWGIKEMLIDREKQDIRVNPIGNAVYFERQDDSSMLLKVLKNHSGFERVIELVMVCENEFLEYDEYCTLTFVQAPKGGVW